MSVRTDFSDSFSENFFARVTGTFNTTQLPNYPGYLCRFKADASNTGTIWLGSARSTGSFPMPWPMAAADDTGWFSMTLDNTTDSQGSTNVFYMNGSSGSCYLSIWIQR